MSANEPTSTGGSASAAGSRRRAVTAFFEDRAAAQAGVDDLIAGGVARSRVTLVEGGPAPVAHEAIASDQKGFWQSLKDLFMADEDRHAYGEGLRRGGCLVSVETSEGDHDRVAGLLDRDGAVDIDARAGEWALEGWDPARAAADLRSSPTTDALPDARPPSAVSPTPRVPVTGPTAIRDPGAGPSHLRAYVSRHARQGPDDPAS